LINYFGKANDIKDIEIAPLLMRKGATKLALCTSAARRRCRGPGARG
jgi:hypothetical protein